MSFIHKLYRDVMIYTIPWVIARYLVYPLVFIDQRLQSDYKKKFENSSGKEKSLQLVFSISQKIAYFKKFIKVGGLKVLFEGWQLYVIPFTTSRLVEGITTTSLMYFFTEILGLKDHFYILFSIALFFRHLFGSFTFRLTQGFQTSKEKFNLAAYLDPNNKRFWKEYEIYHISYQVFRYIQAYMQLSTYWLFNPGFFFKIILYANSRVVGIIGAQPVVWLVRKSQDYGYNYKVAFQDLQKKYGTKNLFTGARDSSIIEATLSVFQIPLEYIVSSFV